MRARQEIDRRQPTPPERIKAEFPEAAVYLEAARRFEAEVTASYQGNGRGVHPDTTDVILLKMAGDAHPGITFNLVCDAYNDSRGLSPARRRHLSYVISIGYQPIPKYLERCRELARKIQEEERRKRNASTDQS